MENGKINPDSVKKFDIKLKSRPKDGVVLQLHHTVRCARGEARRIRFCAACFHDNGETLACADNAGNVFILDLADLKFWKLTGVGLCTALHFVPKRTDTLLIAKEYQINLLDTDTGEHLLTLTGHTAPVKHIAFSKNKVHNLLTASPAEAILWETTNYTKFFTLNTYSGAQIQQILFTPAGEHLVASFQNDTVQIWKHVMGMKPVKQIVPTMLKHIKSIAFTMNGRAMAIAGLAPALILFSMDTWSPLHSIDLTKYNVTGVQQIAFIPQLFDGGANKILAILSNDCIIYVLNLETLTVIHTISPTSSGIKRFNVSLNGKYFICVLQLGEVNIYNSSFVFNQASAASKPKELPSTSANSRHHSPHRSPSKAELEEKMRICMDTTRLRRILMQYGEYPSKFRLVIWKSLLEAPENKTAFTALVNKGIHPSYKDIEEMFTIHSAVTLKNLKRLLSCLAHWCPLFAVMKFLPGFVFPFVKVLQKDPLFLFECVSTVLMNYCQLWFEYAPFPPISVLAMIENVLSEHDQALLDHFCHIGVTSQTYALKILETAFSEILPSPDWLILWDHIFSNEPAFLLMAVVSYNMVQRNALKKLKTQDQLEKFFHTQNPVDKKTFLKKAYVLLNETPEELHPRKFLNTFAALEKGDCYQQFTGYPKATICLKLAKKEKNELKKKYTLKELTTKSQEKIIRDKMRRDDSDSTEEIIKPAKVNENHRFHDPCRGDSREPKVVERIFCSTKSASSKKDKKTRNKKCKSENDRTRRKQYSCSDSSDT